MYCSNCGKQIPDGSRFCMHCGNSIAVISTPEKPSIPTEWEYKCFFWQWEKGKGGKYPLGPGRNEQLAQLFFWNSAQIHILPAIQKEYDDGWQPVSEVGPAGLHLMSRGGNPGWLEVRVFRVKLRRPRTSPFTAYETALLGKWRFIETSGGGMVYKMAYGLASLVGAQIKEMEFFKENQYTTAAEKASVQGHSGIYTFTDAYHFRLDSDPPKVFSLTAELNRSYTEFVVYNMELKTQDRFGKAR